MSILFEEKEHVLIMDKKIAGQLGFWASAIFAVTEGIYIPLIIYTILTVGLSSNFPPLVQLVGGIITFIALPVMVIIFTSIRYVNDDDNEILGSLGVSFILLFAATVSINRFVQLTVIQQSLPDVPADLVRFLPYGTGSVMFALEILGWGFFSSLAALFVAPLFSGSRLKTTIRWFFILYAILSLLSAFSFATNIFIPTGPIAWGPILLVITILLSVYFRNLEKQAA